MKRCYFESSASEFVAADALLIAGNLADQLPYPVEPSQWNAWIHEIEHLKSLLPSFKEAHIFLEFSIPRMGRRADAVLLLNGVVFVLEYKVGKDAFTRHDIEQTVGYALDLSHFHESSHDRIIVPVLVATKAPAVPLNLQHRRDGVQQVVLTNGADLANVLSAYSSEFASHPLDPETWMGGRFKPTPTIVEAAQALYRGHSVEEISRSEAGVDNLSQTCSYIDDVINASRRRGIKSICFVTGVPGSGKTLAGLNLANSRMTAHGDGHAVFLSGNGPLVAVLQAALTADRLEQQRHDSRLPKKSKSQVETETHAFIHNIHHFRDEYVQNNAAPVDRIAVFDEAQRAWDSAQTAKFMYKRGHSNFSMSEPEFLLSVMDRHEGWTTVVCLVGGGQEINTGEAGIREWLRALMHKFPHWNVHLSPQITGAEYMGADAASEVLNAPNVQHTTALHLKVSLRSFRAESVSNFVGALLKNDVAEAARLRASLVDYPLFVTRDLTNARAWLRKQRRGEERSGLLASSNALRLKPEGIFVKAAIDPCKWFLARSEDIRSSTALEDAGSEFDVQGLELDWACVCWDANLRRTNGQWVPHNFSGTTWQNIKQEERAKYLLNSYRVLLTRARQGMVIFVPRGDKADATRVPSMYDPIYEFLKQSNIPELPPVGADGSNVDLPEDELLREFID